MASAKPKCFVGSSTEGLDIARAIAPRLADVAEVTVWKDNIFRPNDGNLEALLRALKNFDFAVFVLSPDDTTTSRGKTYPSPRDNALFEFGLFLGRLDKDRCFAVASDSRDEQGEHVLKLPSDLHGVTIARYEAERADKNWAAAVGNACTVIVDEMRKITRLAERSAQNTESASVVALPIKGPNRNQNEVLEMFGLEDDGAVVVERFEGSASNWFHHERFVSAFPGARGVTEFVDPRVAVERLQLLLQPPLQWVWQDGKHGASGVTPIWWWRGNGNNPIHRFLTLGPEEVLLDCQELPIRRVVAINAGSYWQSFVYIEVGPKPPTGLYSSTPDQEKRHMEIFGYCYEEVGLFNDRYVTRSEYDDGFAVLDGKPRRITGAELRIRYLTPYNLLIAPQDSPINNSYFDLPLKKLMNSILRGNATVADLAREVTRLPRE